MDRYILNLIALVMLFVILLIFVAEGEKGRIIASVIALVMLFVGLLIIGTEGETIRGVLFDMKQNGETVRFEKDKLKNYPFTSKLMDNLVLSDQKIMFSEDGIIKEIPIQDILVEGNVLKKLMNGEYDSLVLEHQHISVQKIVDYSEEAMAYLKTQSRFAKYYLLLVNGEKFRSEFMTIISYEKSDYILKEKKLKNIMNGKNN